MSRPRMVRSAVCVLLALITLLVYLPVRHDSFVYDDLEYVTQNPVVQAGLTWWGFKWAFTTMTTANWYPLTWLSHMLDCQLFGLNAGGHHLVNVLFHAANAVLLFGLLRRLTGTCWPSALIAALFAWHPLHVESVAWVAERKDVLSTFFGLLTLWAYTRYAREQAARSPQPETLPERHAFSLRLLPSSRFYFPALFFFALGLMSKPMLVTVPFVLLLLDYWPLQRVPNYELRFSRWSRLVLEKWPFFLLAAASCVVTFVAQKHGEAVAPLEEYPLSARLGNAAVACLEYLFKSVYPVNLAVFYPLPEGMVWGQVAGAVMVLAVITGLVWRARRQCPYLFTGWFWYLGMLVPVIGVVQVGLQAMADRYMYLPSIGVFMGAVFGLRELAKKLRLAPGVIILVGGIVLAGCLWGTTRQLRCWRNSETLFRHALAVTENNYPAHNNLGAALDAEGQSAEAIRQFQAALRLAPDYADAHNNLGIALNQEGQSAEAIRQFQEAVRLKPDFSKALNNLGNAFATIGRFDEAIKSYRQAIQINSNNPETFLHLGMVLDQLGRTREAVAQYREALRLNPNLLEALNNLAWALATSSDDQLRNGAEAVRLAERACELTHYSQPLIMGTLAAAYAEVGRFPEAVAAAEKAEKLAMSAGLTAVAADDRQLLELYRAGKPYHEPSGAASTSARTPPYHPEQ